VVSGDAAEGGCAVGVAVLTVDADGEVVQAAMTRGTAGSRCASAPTGKKLLRVPSGTAARKRRLLSSGHLVWRAGGGGSCGRRRERRCRLPGPRRLSIPRWSGSEALPTARPARLASVVCRLRAKRFE
jgi:hypothetical protein